MLTLRRRCTLHYRKYNSRALSSLQTTFSSAEAAYPLESVLHKTLLLLILQTGTTAVSYCTKFYVQHVYDALRTKLHNYRVADREKRRWKNTHERVQGVYIETFGNGYSHCGKNRRTPYVGGVHTLKATAQRRRTVWTVLSRQPRGTHLRKESSPFQSKHGHEELNQMSLLTVTGCVDFVEQEGKFLTFRAG